MAQERIFPIFLDGATQLVTAAGSWNGETSRVVVTAASAAYAFALGDATIPGTLVSIMQDDATGGAVTINVSSPVSGDTTFNQIVLDSLGEIVTLMWTGSEWFFMGSTEATTVS